MKIGQVWQYRLGYFKIVDINEKTRLITVVCNDGRRTLVPDNSFVFNISKGYVHLIEDEIEKAKALLIF